MGSADREARPPVGAYAGGREDAEDDGGREEHEGDRAAPARQVPELGAGLHPAASRALTTRRRRRPEPAAAQRPAASAPARAPSPAAATVAARSGARCAEAASPCEGASSPRRAR